MWAGKSINDALTSLAYDQEKSIRILPKVFFTVLLSTACAIAVMVLLVQWNLSRGFLSYVNESDKQRLAEMADRFAQEYRRHGNWAWATNGAAWRSITGPRQLRRRPPPEGRPSPDARPPPAGRLRREPFDAGQDRRGRPPRNRPPRRGPNSLGIGPRVSLFDASGLHIMGRGKTMSDESVRQAIAVDGTVVGWLSALPVKQLRALRDVNFLRQQSRSFVLIGAGLLLGAALLAYIFARHLTRPLTGLTAFVRRLAAGEYQARLAVNGQDEIAGLSRDINTLANSLDENQTARQRWIADISHELRTPLAIIQGEVEAIRDGVRPANAHTIDSLHTEVVRLGKLVNDLHELSLSDAGALSYQLRPIVLADLLGDLVQRFAPRYEKHELKLRFDYNRSETSTVMGDNLRLAQLFSNLLENSLRYTDPGGEVCIDMHRRRANVVVKVSDTKPGVDAEACQHLFERLYRVDGSRSRKGGGSGLGLAIVKNIAQAHHAQIHAEPSALGGLAIVLEVPLVSELPPVSTQLP